MEASIKAPRVDILLSTYNGSKYIQTLLQSINLQSYSNWHLIIRDDGSVDNTSSILQKYHDACPDRVELIKDNYSRLGPCKSFSLLMEHSTANYIMFCDQDDVWIENKIELLLDAMHERERRYGDKTPILIHSDLKVVDDRLETISESFWRYQKIQPKIESKFSRQLMQNVVTGSATIMNRLVVRIAAPIPSGAIMHDWWVALVVSAFGYIHHISTVTVLYRQHNTNQVGAKKWGYIYVQNTALSLFSTNKIKKSIALCQKQAQDFVVKYNYELKPENRTVAKTLANIEKLGPIARRRAIFRYQLIKYGLIKNIGLFLAI